MRDLRWEGHSNQELVRKEQQAWEMAGLARMDRDKADEKRWTDEARRLGALLREEESK
jgi:hypothetical protein